MPQEPPSAPAPEAARVALALEELAILTVRRLGAPREISLTAATTLSYLDRNGVTRLTVLAAEQCVSQPSMTQLVQRLERDGLVHRAADPQDGRVLAVAVTEAGRALLAERRRRRAGLLAQLIGQLPPDDRRALADAAETLLPLLRRLGGG